MRSPDWLGVVTALATLALSGCGSSGSSASGRDAGEVDGATLDGGAVSEGGPTDAGGVRDAAPDPRWPACDPAKTSQTISFVHVNDLHANYQLDSAGVSPYARIRGYYDSVLAQNPYTVFTSGGDEYEKGALAEVLSSGASTLPVLAAMKFDVRVIGNHDYAWNENEVLLMSHDARANVLETNMQYEGDSSVGFGAGDFAAIQIGCVRVGFAGLVSQPWNEQDEQVQTPFYPDFAASYDFTGEAQKIIAAHRSQVDLLVFVDHIGLTLDELTAETAPGIDVILSGHSHDLTTTPDVVKATPIVQSGAFAEHVVRLDVTYDLTQHAVSGTHFAVTNVDTTLAPESAMQTTVAGVLQQYAPHADDPVAQVQNTGTATSIATVAAKAAIAKFSADAAVVDTQTVWDLWTPGPVSDQILLNAFKIERELPGTPGFNSFYTSQVTGTQLQTIQSAAGTRFVTVMPAAIVPAQTYLLVLQKRPAYNPGGFFPGLTLTGITFGSEAWEALDFYAQQRQKACMYLDVDAMITGCM
jgi:2',3'-cyclic-nucleotide 2'-phosphodiesterase (5'-nucleotidase family)